MENRPKLKYDDTLPRLRRRKSRWRQWVMDSNMSPAYKVALYYLAENCTKWKTALNYEKTGRVIINPSQKTIALQAKVNRKTVNVAIKLAIKDGYLELINKGSGLSGSSEYRMMPVRTNV
jgi:hypothetical protein